MYIGIDIGGTTTKLGLFNNLDSTEFKPLDAFPTQSNYLNQMKQIQSKIDTFKTKHLDGIGISIGAQVSKDGTCVFASSNLPDYLGKPIVNDLANIYQCQVRLAHDCVCGLIAEKKFGEIKAVDRVAYITISTGTGSSVQLRQLDQVITFSNEFGHQIVEPDGYRCLCGQRGCLETITGGKQKIGRASCRERV